MSDTEEASGFSDIRSSGKLRALVQKISLGGSGAEVDGGLVHLDVASANNVPSLLDVNEELKIPCPLLGEEVEGEEELPGLVEEGNSRALGGVDTLKLVSGKLSRHGDEEELETESEESGGLAGENLSLSDSNGLRTVHDINSRGSARAINDALEAGEKVKRE